MPPNSFLETKLLPEPGKELLWLKKICYKCDGDVQDVHQHLKNALGEDWYNNVVES